MDEFIKLLDPAYELIQYRIKEDKVIFHIASTITELECPFCGSKTSKVHSIYQREIQDLPMQGKKVILLVDTRKMRCMNPDCSHKTFSEKHPFVTAKSKKTNRLIQNILYKHYFTEKVSYSQKIQKYFYSNHHRATRRISCKNIIIYFLQVYPCCDNHAHSSQKAELQSLFIGNKVEQNIYA